MVAPASPPVAAGMLIDIEMKSPEIYLVENQDDTNTQALLIKVSESNMQALLIKVSESNMQAFLIKVSESNMQAFLIKVSESNTL